MNHCSHAHASLTGKQSQHSLVDLPLITSTWPQLKVNVNKQSHSNVYCRTYCRWGIQNFHTVCKFGYNNVLSYKQRDLAWISDRPGCGPHLHQTHISKTSSAVWLTVSILTCLCRPAPLCSLSGMLLEKRPGLSLGLCSVHTDEGRHL